MDELFFAAPGTLAPTLAAGLFGLLIGSFLNVVIARVPERRSLWQPGSACPSRHVLVASYGT